MELNWLFSMTHVRFLNLNFFWLEKTELKTQPTTKPGATTPLKRGKKLPNTGSYIGKGLLLLSTY
jgi:hypothetical protein